MHIIITGYLKSWPNSLKKSILLGDWCINEKSRSLHKINKIRIFEYHYNDRKNLYNSYEKINSTYFKVLKTLNLVLNDVFKKSNNTRYWEIIWGAWLYTFISVLYDRSVSIKNVLKKYPNSKTNILDPKSYIIATNSIEYLDNIQNDFYNFQLYSSLWTLSKGNVDSIINTNLLSKKNGILNGLNFQNIYHKFKNYLIKTLFNNSDTVTFSTGFPKYLLLKIILKSKFRIFPFELIENQIGNKINSLKPNYILRKELKKKLIKNNSSDDNFLNLCLELISDHVPISILEGYNDIIYFNNKNTKNFSYLFSANSLLKDTWNILCAENINNNGAKLINSQHGGGYGIQLFCGFEDFEIRLADKYITMGWSQEVNKNKYISMPSPIINKIKYSNLEKNNKILIIGNEYPRYFYRMFSHPIGKYVKIYRNWFDKFLDNIDKNISSNLLVRLYPIDQAGTHNILKKKYDYLEFNNINSFNNQLLSCRVAVSDTNQTTYLQSMALNIPTIIFWNPNSSEIRTVSKPFINELNKVGILHFSPESASNFLNLNYESITDWWYSKDVQNVRINFITNYAKINKGWEKDWIRFFNQIDKIYS